MDRTELISLYRVESLKGQSFLPHFHIIQLLKLETLLIVKKSNQVLSFLPPHFQVIQLLKLDLAAKTN